MNHDIENHYRSGPSENSRNLSPEQRLAYVWARMTERYGQPWVSVHGTSPSRIGAGEWGEIVADLDDDEIRAGFTADLSRGSDFPPSSSRFRALCRPVKSRQELSGAYEPFRRNCAIESEHSRKVGMHAIEELLKELSMPQERSL